MNTLLKILLRRYGRLTIDLLVIGGILHCVCTWEKTGDQQYFGGFLILLIFMWLCKVHDTVKFDNENKD